MAVHPAVVRLAVPLDHAQKFPAVALVKPGMVCEQIEGVNPQGRHVLAHGAEHLARQPSPPVGFFHIEGTQVGGQVGPVVKIVLNDPRPGEDAPMFHDEIPLGHRLLPLQARPDALSVGFLRDTPFLVEPGRRRFRPFSVVPQLPYKLFLDTRAPLSKLVVWLIIP